MRKGNPIHARFQPRKSIGGDGKLGRGKRVEIPAVPLGPSGVALERTTVIEAYDDFPGMMLVSVAYKNSGAADFAIDQAVVQQHRFSAAVENSSIPPYEMWSFQGSSYDWGKDDVMKLTRTSAQPNLMGAAVKGVTAAGFR